MKTKEFLAQDWVKQEIINRLNYNPKTGSLTWAKRDYPYFDDTFAGKQVGSIYKRVTYIENSFKLEIKGKKVNLQVARVCWLVHTSDWPKYTIDHIDRNPLNNKWENLRDVTQKVNNSNKGIYKKGNHIFFRYGFWQVRFYNKVVGRSKCFGEAVKIRNKYMRENTR